MSEGVKANVTGSGSSQGADVLKGQFGFFCCVRNLSIVSALYTVVGGQHAPSLEKQMGVASWILSNALVWMAVCSKKCLANGKRLI